jgi:hypothetical protein
MPKSSIVGPNPLPAAYMTPEERSNELATILAAGLIRARHRAALKAAGKAPRSPSLSLPKTDAIGKELYTAVSPSGLSKFQPGAERSARLRPGQ